MTPQDILALVQLVIQFILQLFGKQPTSVVEYINGKDVGVAVRPFVMAYRKMQLKSFVKSYATLHGLDAGKAYEAVLAELQKVTVGDVVKVASQLPSK